MACCFPNLNPDHYAGSAKCIVFVRPDPTFTALESLLLTFPM